MTRRSKLWLAAASLFTVLNLGGAGFAAADGEWLHTAAHIGLMLVGAYFVWRIASRAQQPQLSGVEQSDERLEHLQQSVDAIALEVERIGEGQRFITKLAEKRAEPSPLKPQP